MDMASGERSVPGGGHRGDVEPRSEAEAQAQRLLRSLAERRKQLRMSQTAVAARMGTSQSSLARIEAGDIDPRISTVERLALALGAELTHQPRSTTTSVRSRERRRG
jgi:transcriptional regulator with XRE-family HTH domain